MLFPQPFILFPRIGLQYQRDLLHQEAIIGDEESMKKLLLRGFDVDEQDQDKNTALPLAAREGKENFVNVLTQLCHQNF